MFGCGVTLDVDARAGLGVGRDNLLAKQLPMAEHLSSLSELETE